MSPAPAKTAREAPEEPCFLNEPPESDEIPAYVNLGNVRERFGVKPGETLEQALARLPSPAKNYAPEEDPWAPSCIHAPDGSALDISDT